MPRRSRKIRGQIRIAYLAVFLIYLLDQLSKLIVERYMSIGESLPVVKNFLHITLIHNTGAAFGVLKTRSFLFVVVAIFSILVINYMLIYKRHVLIRPERIALFFILAGTLGNLTDRLRVGYVIDFIDFRVWPVFNIADSFITVGAVILGASLILGRKK
jgi:signal peptidase II